MSQTHTDILVLRNQAAGAETHRSVGARSQAADCTVGLGRIAAVERSLEVVLDIVAAERTADSDTGCSLAVDHTAADADRGQVHRSRTGPGEGTEDIDSTFWRIDPVGLSDVTEAISE